MSRVYGKKVRRTLVAGNIGNSPRLESAFEFSPEKEVRSKLSQSSKTIKDEADELQSQVTPLNSPRRSTRLASRSSENSPAPREAEKDFVSEESKPKQAYKKRTLRARSKQPKASKEKEATSQLNDMFVEAKEKPRWSPHFSPSNSRDTSFDSDSLSRKKLSFEDRPVRPKSSNLNDGWDLLDHLERKTASWENHKLPDPALDEETNVKGEQEHNTITTKHSLTTARLLKSKATKIPEPSEWDLFDTIVESTPKSNRKLLTKSHLRSPSKNRESSGEEHELIKFFDSQSGESQDPDTLKTEATPDSENVKEVSQSPVKRSRRMYGERRSYLAQREGDAEPEEPEDEDQDDQSSDHDDIEGTRDLQTISHLRAQGENAQFQDELNFLLEGIESGNSLSGLLELALRLFEGDFLRFIKSQSLTSLYKSIDSNDPVQRYIWAFIVVQTADGASDNLSFDEVLLQLVSELITDIDCVELTKGSKSTRSLFKDFQSRVDKPYTPLYFGLTLLLQNPKLVNHRISKNIIHSVAINKNISDLDHKNFQMSLILLEDYLSRQDEIHEEFKEIVPMLMKHPYKDEATIILTLKVLILLSVKKFQYLDCFKLLQKAISDSKVTRNDEVLLLYIGLLINLIEEESCFAKITQRGNLSAIHSLYAKTGQSSIGYYALLVGIIYKQKQEVIEKVFNIDELKTLKHELQKFDSKGNHNMTLHVEDVLSHYIF